MKRLINVKNSFNNSIGAYISIGSVVLNNLSFKDRDREVVYTSPNGESEFGYLSSWNDDYGFVLFNTGDTASACSPDQLQFVREDAEKVLKTP